MPVKKKSPAKTSSKSTANRLTKKQYEAVHRDVVKDIERLEADLDLDLKELKQKLNCFCHDVFSRFSARTVRNLGAESVDAMASRNEHLQLLACRAIRN